MLKCADCGEEYLPLGCFAIRPIGERDERECPHPTFGEPRSALAKDGPWLRRCLVCGTVLRYMPVPCAGGPLDGVIEPSLITPEDGTSVGAMRMFSTTQGQQPDEHGSTVMFTYILRFGPDGFPFWDGRTVEERAIAEPFDWAAYGLPENADHRHSWLSCGSTTEAIVWATEGEDALKRFLVQSAARGQR